MDNWRTWAYKRLYDKLDSTVKEIVDGAWESYKRDPSLVDFAQKGRLKGVPHFGAHLNDNWRALAFKRDGVVVWYWVGPHVDYDRILKGLSK